MKQKHVVKKLFLDTIPVIIGILIAVVISNIQQHYANRAYLRSTISSIKAQNIENIKELEYAIERQEQLADTLGLYLEDEHITFIDAVVKARGFNTPDLKSSTWRILFENGNHTLVPYEVLNQLSEIEKYEELVRNYGKALTQLFYSTEAFENPHVKNVALGMIWDFRHTEETMIKEIHKFDSLTSDYR